MESIFVSSQTLRLSRNPEAKLRPVPEWGRCLVYTPENPELFELNATAWLALELCDGRPLEAVEADFADAVAEKMPPDEARRDFQATIDRLLAMRVLVEAPAS
jgi:hypothetical protein